MNAELEKIIIVTNLYDTIYNFTTKTFVAMNNQINNNQINNDNNKYNLEYNIDEKQKFEQYVNNKLIELPSLIELIPYFASFLNEITEKQAINIFSSEILNKFINNNDVNDVSYSIIHENNPNVSMLLNVNKELSSSLITYFFVFLIFEIFIFMNFMNSEDNKIMSYEQNHLQYKILKL